MPEEWKATVRPKTVGHHFPSEEPPSNSNVIPYQKTRRPTTAFVQRVQTDLYARNEKAMTLEEAKARIRLLDVNNPENWYRKRDYEFHLERVRTARPLIDTKCPVTNKSSFTSNVWFNKRQLTFAKIAKDNAILLKRISDIGTRKERNLRGTVIHGSTSGKELQRQNELIRITLENLTLMKRLEKPRRTMYNRKKFLEEYARNEEIAQKLSKWPLFWNLRKSKGWEEHENRAILNALHNPRPIVYFTLHTKAKRLGRLIIELRADVCPMTAENFRSLCTGESGPSYKCTTLNRLIPGVLWQGGTGTGPGASNKIPSIFGKPFHDENFKLKHDGEGIVSMSNTGPNTNTSQFLITTKKMEYLDGKNVVFGKVIGGMGILNQMAKDMESKCGVVYKNSIRKIIIMHCGELAPGEPFENDTLEDPDKDYYDEDDDEINNPKKTSQSQRRNTIHLQGPVRYLGSSAGNSTENDTGNDTGNETGNERSENENAFGSDSYEDDDEKEGAVAAADRAEHGIADVIDTDNTNTEGETTENEEPKEE